MSEKKKKRVTRIEMRNDTFDYAGISAVLDGSTGEIRYENVPSIGDVLRDAGFDMEDE